MSKKKEELAMVCAKKYEEALYNGEITPDDVVMVKKKGIKEDNEKLQKMINKSATRKVKVKEDGLYKDDNRITNYVPRPIVRIKMRDRYNIEHDLVCVAIITKDLGDKEEIYVMKEKVFTGVGYEQKCCVKSNGKLGSKLPKTIENKYNDCKGYLVNLRYGWSEDEYRSANGEEIGLTVEEEKDVIDKIRLAVKEGESVIDNAKWIKGFPKSIAYPLLGFVFLSICKSKIQQAVDISDICLAYQAEQDVYNMVEFFLHISFLHDKSFLRSKGIYKFDYRELGDIAENIYDINNPDAIAMRVSEKLLGKKKQYLDESLNSYADIEKNILSRIRDIPVLISNTNIKSQMKPLVEAAKCGVIIEYEKVPPKNENMFILSNEYKAPDDISKNKEEYLNFVKFIIEQFPRETFKFEGKEMPFEEFWDNIEKVALKNECEQRAKIALLVGLCAVSCIMGSEINEELVKQYINDFSGKADNKFKKPKDTMKDTKEFIKNLIDFYDENKDNGDYFTTNMEKTPEVGWINNNMIVLVERNKEGKKRKKQNIEDWIHKYIECNIRFEDVKSILYENQVIDVEEDEDGVHYKKKRSKGKGQRAIHIKIDGARAFIEEKIPGNK